MIGHIVTLRGRRRQSRAEKSCSIRVMMLPRWWAIVDLNHPLPVHKTASFVIKLQRALWIGHSNRLLQSPNILMAGLCSFEAVVGADYETVKGIKTLMLTPSLSRC